MSKSTQLFMNLVTMTIILIVMFTFPSCTAKQNDSLLNTISESESDKYPSGLTDEDFIISNNFCYIQLGGSYEETRANEELIDFRPIDEAHLYETFEYNNFVLSVSPNIGDGSKVLAVAFKSSIMETSRGIKIGDNISDVIEKYGDAERILPHSSFYHYEHKYINFYYDDNDNIIGIVFELI